MISFRPFFWILVFLLALSIANAQESLDLSKGPVNVGGATVTGGNGFSIFSNGNFQSSGGSAIIDGHKISGDVTQGNIGSGKLSGTASGAGAKVAGISIFSGAKFELDLKTGELTIITPNGGDIPIGDKEVNLEKGSEVTINKNGNIRTKGRSRIKDGKGNVATGTDILYDASEEAFFGKNDLEVETSDGKKASGTRSGGKTAISVKRMTKEQADEFLRIYKNTAALNVEGFDLMQWGFIKGTVTENGIPTSITGIKPETIVRWGGEDILFEYSGGERRFAVAEIGYKVGDELHSMVALLEKKPDELNIKFLASSLNPLTKESLNGKNSKETKEVRKKFIEASRKKFEVNKVNFNFKKVSGTKNIIKIENPGRFIDGRLFDTVEKIILNTPTPRVNLGNSQVQNRHGVDTLVFPARVSTTIAGELTSDLALSLPASELVRYQGATTEETLTNVLMRGPLTIDASIQHSKGKLASFPMINTLRDALEVAGIQDPNQPYYQTVMTALRDKVEGGKVRLSIDTQRSTITLSKSSLDPSPVTVSLPPSIVGAIREEYVERLIPTAVKHLPVDWRTRLGR